MHSNTPLVIANWKLNGGTDLICASVAAFIKHNFQVQIGIAPPYVYISDMANFLKNTKILVGSQNVSKFESGAFTGETSAQMLKEVGCQFCLIGHSERRQVFLENDSSCHTKVLRAHNAGMLPVVCIGENSQQRDLGLTKHILYKQLHESLNGLDLSNKEICIAYEPVWAIGTGQAASVEIVEEIHSYIHQELATIFDQETADKIKILYGGSVNKSNASAFLKTNYVDGLLVGGASLDPEHFSEICAQANAICCE